MRLSHLPELLPAGLGEVAPKRSTLHDKISRIRAQTLQALHKILVEHAVLSGLESGSAVRTDTAPVAQESVDI